MISRLLKHKDALNEYLKDKSLTGLTESEWHKLQSIAEVLKPCKTATEHLGGEKYVSSSILLPVTAELLYLNRQDDDDPSYISRFKQTLTKDIESRRDLMSANMFLKSATALDPRYKCLKYIASDMREGVWSHLVNLVKLNLLSADEQSTELTVSCSKAKRPKVDYESSDEEDNDINDCHTQTLKIVNLYRQLPEINREADPLTWWQQHRNTYPHLTSLAMKHLGCPASSVPSERLFSSAGNIISKKRASLHPENANKLICLSSWL